MTAARAPGTEPTIAERAYSIWEEEGRPHGRDRAHWERAERELSGPPPAAAGIDAPVAAPADPAAPPKPARTRKAAAAKDPDAPKPTRRKATAAADSQDASAAAARPKRPRTNSAPA